MKLELLLNELIQIEYIPDISEYSTYWTLGCDRKKGKRNMIEGEEGMGIINRKMS